MGFLPEAQLPNDLGWAISKPNIAGAFSRFSAVIEEVGSYSLSSEVRNCVKEKVKAWNGQFPSLGKSWVENIAKEFTGSEKTTIRLALLAALAPNQVEKEDILAFRKHFPQDTKLIGVLAWASFSAARRIGNWLHVPEV